MDSLGTPYFFQATEQGAPQGALLLKKQNIAPGVPIIASVPFGDAQAGDVLTLTFGGARLGEPLEVSDIDRGIYDISVDVAAWPESEADVLVTLTRGGGAGAVSDPVRLKVVARAKENDSTQRYEGLLLGNYGVGLLDSWIVASSYHLDVATSAAFSALSVGTNADNASLSLKRLMSSRDKDELLGHFVFESGSWTYVSATDVDLTRGDQLGLFQNGAGNVQLAFEYSI
ncbi:hypothetical protein [Pandoraea bronchicola]|uniref:Uncharacterized protein n=1 Tax=Pandoraea bronchicola TaxID=2508287 RepID=A0A5E5C1J7_9BURK|nr:hypothetical protein [Pandoraea bronchicola]VVE90500.1 hypothetical protein PBR20603_04485 [Pandoraea bronchicola]